MADKTFLQTISEMEAELTLRRADEFTVEELEEFQNFLTKLKARLKEEEVGSSLANCPACQESPKAIENVPNMAGEPTFAVVCLICFCRGPRGKTKEEAAKHWKCLSDGHNPMRLQAEVEISRCNAVMDEAGWLQDDPTWTSIIDRVRDLCSAWKNALKREKTLGEKLDTLKRLVS